MFKSDHVPVLYKGAKLRIGLSPEGHKKRIAEATFVIDNFNATLAMELGANIRAHLYDDEGHVRPELNGIDLDLHAPLQRVQFRRHRELPPEWELDPVVFGGCKADKEESDKTGRSWLKFTFTLTFDLTSREARNCCIDAFGTNLFLSFYALQGGLFEPKVRKLAKDIKALPAAQQALAMTAATATPDEREQLGKMAQEVLDRRRGKAPAPKPAKPGKGKRR